MPLIITKNSDRNFSHSDGFKTMNFSNWEIVFDETLQTVILQLPNGAPFPQVAVNVGDVTVDGVAYATTALLRAELVSVGYNPLVTSGGGGGATNLGYNPSATSGEVTSSTGISATIPLADGTNAGLSENNLSDALKTSYDGAVTDVATIAGVLSDFESDINDINSALPNFVEKSNNLSDVTNVATARTNLSVYSKTEVDAKISIKTLYLNTADSTPSTGTTAEVIHYTIPIPANTIPANCAITVFSKGEKNNDTGTFTLKLQKNTSAVLAGATQLSTYTTGASPNRIAPILKTFALNAGNLKCFPTTTSSISDLGTVSLNPTLVPFDVSVDNYIMVTLTGSSGATLKMNYVEVTLKY